MGSPFAAAARIQGTGPRASFGGATQSRLFYDWAVGAIHPDREVRWAIRHLRARARDLVRNNPYATGIVEAFADNLIGWEETGIRLKPNVLGPDGKPLRRVNTEIKRGWSEWSCDYASVDGQDSWLDLQRLLVKTWVTDGEVFIRERRGYDNPYAYAVELIDADMLDETFNVPPNPRGVEIRMGIEMDSRGRRLAYHFFKHHPSEGRGRERTRVSASEITHFFIRYRVGQNRGYTLFAPVLTTVKMIDGFTEAELVASRLAAAKMGFITNDSPEAIAAYAERLRILNEEGKEAEPQTFDVAPGLIPELQPGQGFEGFDPTHPNTAFEAFLKVMLRGVARAFSMSYLTLTGDVGEANYSSMRAGLVPERDHWRVLQEVLSQKIHRRVYRSWIASALLAGALRLPTRVPSDYLAHEWRPRGWKWVDPLKDLLAAELGIALGVTSRGRVASAQGHDFETVVDELADEEDYAESKDVDVSGLKRSDDPSSVDEDGPKKNGRSPGAGPDQLSRIAHLLEESENGKH